MFLQYMPYALSYKPLLKILGTPVSPADRHKRILRDQQVWRVTYPIYGKYKQCLVTFKFHHTMFGIYYLDGIEADLLDGRMIDIPMDGVKSRYFDYRGLLQTIIHNNQKRQMLKYQYRQEQVAETEVLTSYAS